MVLLPHPQQQQPQQQQQQQQQPQQQQHLTPVQQETAEGNGILLENLEHMIIAQECQDPKQPKGKTPRKVGWLSEKLLCTVGLGSLVGLVVKASGWRAEDPELESHLQRDFSRSSHTNDLSIDTPVATLPGAWRYRVSAGAGWLGVSILWLGEVKSLVCNLCLSVAAHKIVRADLSLIYTSMLLGR